MTNHQQYFIELAYDGTNYHGWQIQPNAITVQQVLNEALSTVLRHKVATVGCGRTDAGVHARQFFAHLELAGPGDDDLKNTCDLLSTGNRILRSLNALLPPDVAVKRIIPVRAGAHARFDATSRSYEYHIHFEKDPFLNQYSWLLRDRPDVELMNKAALILKTYTDFGCFSKSHTQVKTNNCKISDAVWIEQGDKLVFYISADRFLRNMVRAIVGTLLMVGRGEIEPAHIRQIIESKNRSNAGASVPACGLYLTKVEYPFV